MHARLSFLLRHNSEGFGVGIRNEVFFGHIEYKGMTVPEETVDVVFLIRVLKIVIVSFPACFFFGGKMRSVFIEIQPVRGSGFIHGSDGIDTILPFENPYIARYRLFIQSRQGNRLKFLSLCPKEGIASFLFIGKNIGCAGFEFFRSNVVQR